MHRNCNTHRPHTYPCQREEDKQEQHKVTHIKQVPIQDGSNENSLQHQNNCLNEHQMQARGP